MRASWCAATSASTRRRMNLPPDPGGDERHERHEAESDEIANQASIDIGERDRLGRAHRRMQIEAGDQRGVRPQPADALRVVGFEEAAIPLVGHDLEDLRFGQRLADPIAGIGHAGEHRAVAIGHHQDGARRKFDVRESRREPVQVLHHEDDPFELARRARQRVGIVDRGKLRDAADLIVADGEVVHLERHLEVRAIRDIDGPLERQRAAEQIAVRIGYGDIQVQRVRLQHLRQERTACGRVLRVELRQPGERRQHLARGLDLGGLVAGDDPDEPHRVVVDACRWRPCARRPACKRRATSHGTSMRRTRASNRSRRLKKRAGAASIAWSIATPSRDPA